jgi:2-alkenal reductase
MWRFNILAMNTRQIVIVILMLAALLLVVCTLLAGGLVFLAARSGTTARQLTGITPQTVQPARVPAQATRPAPTVTRRTPATPTPTEAVAEVTATGVPSEATPTLVRPAFSPTPFPTVVPVPLNVEEQELIQVYEKVNPSVVNINVQQQVEGSGGQPFQFSGSGSGFIVDKEGRIVTNYHVVQNATTIEVVLYDDTRGPARLVGADPDSDVAVIQVDLPADRLIPVELGDSDQVKVGQRAIAIGNPFGFQGTMTIGIVSGIGRTIQSGTSPFSIPQVIQTDAPINPGNSGGPLLDAAGRVIGVNAQIRSEDRANSGVGFAVPINVVKKILPDLIARGSYTWPWLGVSGTTLDPAQVKADNLSVDRGAYIASVVEGGPADKAGVRGERGRTTVDGRRISVGGDVVIAIDGTPVHKFDDLLIYVTQRGRVGQTVTLIILRDGQQRDIQVTLEARPKSVQQ